MTDTIRDGRRHNFFIIDNEILDRGLSTQALAVYMVIARYSDRSGKAWPGAETIATHAGMSRPTAIKALNELVAAKLLSYENRTNASGMKTSNLYTLAPVEKGSTDVKDVYNDVKELYKDVNDVDNTDVKDVYMNNTSGEQNTKDEDDIKLSEPEAVKVWAEVLKELKLQVTSDVFEVYLMGLKPLAMNGKMELLAPTSLMADYIDRARIRKTIERELKAQGVDGFTVTS